MYPAPPPQIAGKLQPTLYRAESSADDTAALVDYAVRHKTGAVGVFPVYVAHAARLLSGSNTRLATRIGHLGLSKPTIKAIEAASAIKDGAAEIEVEPLLASSLTGNVHAVRSELHEIVRACRAVGKPVLIKSVIRSALLQRAGGESLVEVVCNAMRQGAVDGLIDIGDDASHAIVRSVADGMFIQRSNPAVDWQSIVRCDHPKLDRVEVYMELIGLEGLAQTP